LLRSAAPGAPFTTKNIQELARATASAGGGNKGRLDILILSKRFEKRWPNFCTALLMRRPIQRIVAATPQPFLSAQLELTRTVSPCELKQTA
jgi:hypothetical protein